MTQNGRNVNFIYNINSSFFACNFLQATDYYTVNKFVTHFTSKFRRIEIFFYITYKIVGILFGGFRFIQFFFKIVNFFVKSVLLRRIAFYKTDTDILRNFAFDFIFVNVLYKSCQFFRAFTFPVQFFCKGFNRFIGKFGIVLDKLFSNSIFIENDSFCHIAYIFKHNIFQSFCKNSPEHLKLTKEHVTKTEKEIETADKTAISSNTGSYKLCHTAPKPPERFLCSRGFA